MMLGSSFSVSDLEGTLCSLLKQFPRFLNHHEADRVFENDLLRNLYAGQEATVRTGHETTDWFQIGKGVRQGCILSPCLFNLHGEYIMRNAGLHETQTGIKIAGKSINNFKYADDTTLMF